MINMDSQIELMLRYERTLCLILMQQYGRALRASFT
jgi:hypothetical protein